MTDAGTDAGQEAAFRAMVAGFERARSAVPDQVTERRLRICGRPVRVRVVGLALARRILEATAHLGDHVEGALLEPALDIAVWDATVHGPEPDAPPEGAPRLTPECPTAASRDGRYVGHRVHSTLSWLDRHTRRLLVCVDGTARLSLFERGRPLQFPLLLWLRDRGVVALHGGMVSDRGRGVLFLGDGGAGKSTSAVLCACAGMGFLSDDYIGLESHAEGTFRGHSLFGSVHMEPAHLARFPLLHERAVTDGLPEEDKHLVQLTSLPGGPALEAHAPVRLLLLPRVAGRADTTCAPVSKVRALLEAAPSSMRFLPMMEAWSLDVLSDLVKRVPAFRLELGTDLAQIPVRVRELLERVERTSPA